MSCNSSPVSTSQPPSHSFFLSPKSQQPLRDFALAHDGYTYNHEDLPEKTPYVTNKLLQTAAAERRNNPNAEHWQRNAVESPLSLRIMVRPVQLSDGNVYDLEEAYDLLENWGTSPFTGQPFAAEEWLIPNRAMQAMGADYVQNHPEAVDDETLELLTSPLPTYHAIAMGLGVGARERMARHLVPLPEIANAHRERDTLISSSVTLAAASVGMAIAGTISVSSGVKPAMVLVWLMYGACLGAFSGVPLARLIMLYRRGVGGDPIANIV